MRAVTLGLLASLLLAACGSSSMPDAARTGQPSTATSPATSSPPAPPATSSTATTVTATGTTTTPVAQSGECAAPGLALTFLGQQGATGHGELGFALRNTTSHSCQTGGYPGIEFVTGSGAPLPTATTRTTNDFFGSLSVRRLTVAPGAGFSFRVGVTHGIASSAGCTTAAAILVIAPDDTVQLHVAIPEGAYECGTATVSPVAPGDAAYVGG